MKTFNKSDLITWANRDKAQVGKKYYFADSLMGMQRNINKPSLIEVLEDIDENNIYASFGYSRDDINYNHACILPVDKVIEEGPEKRYRPFKDAHELYKFLVNLSLARKDFSNKLLLNLPITWRKNDTSNFTTTEIITSVEVAVIDGCQLTSINSKELNYWFNNYEIEIDGEWQPFGVLED